MSSSRTRGRGYRGQQAGRGRGRGQSYGEYSQRALPASGGGVIRDAQN